MHARFAAAFSQLPAELQAALTPVMASDTFNAVITAAQVDAIGHACHLDRQALSFALLPLAAACALTPISHFQVGAIVHGASGNLYFGANMEFSGAPLQQTIHAEQCAITHAWLRGETALTSITVNCTPCGHCRQFMNELNSGTSLPIHLPGRHTATLGDYLPDAFGPRDLQIKTLLLDPTHHGLMLDNAAGDPLQQAALDAANASHAPYSQAYSGVAVETPRAVYAGRYAENAAFNPSLPPLQAALILLNMSGDNVNAIRRAALVESRQAPLSQYAATRATLQALGCNDLQHHPL
ncbi:cytidine deaminase [Edwardsiella ictaluri]|uniref:cytidine deaminase n=1 Tax=Edwardsiella ictaluri TaxID=67780 RepID=UPI0009BD9E7F|nr:cytidine deaminase [Edwardsiella ictaluri]ARD40790.1 cytidine deaminase [Edwardsiella ictaluri]QPW26341.1 cytidine deaminase [Edwardsiella ictaluri]